MGALLGFCHISLTESFTCGANDMTELHTQLSKKEIFLKDFLYETAKLISVSY